MKVTPKTGAKSAMVSMQSVEKIWPAPPTDMDAVMNLAFTIAHNLEQLAAVFE
jgi:hypothetical protein